MRIACPSCAAEYDVPAARLTPHKMVRCTCCGGEWLPEQEAVEPVADPAQTYPEHSAAVAAEARPDQGEPAPRVTVMARLAASAAIPCPRVSLRGAWVLTVVVLAGAVTATVVWRKEVIRVWPPSARILAPFGQFIPEPGHTEPSKPK